MRYMEAAEVSRVTGCSTRQLHHWVERGFIHPAKKNKYKKQERNLFDTYEVDVISLMIRLIGAGWNDLAKMEAIARKHFADVDTLLAMGYDGDSVATEHTVGDGLVLTIT